MARERSILERIKNRIETVNGSGSFAYDLSGADQVKIGAKFSGDRLPSAYVYATGITTEQVAGRTTLVNYDRPMSVNVELFVGANSADPGEVHLVGIDAASDIMIALENDRSLNGNANDLEIAMSTFDGEEFDMPGIAVVVCQMQITYSETAGA